MLLPRESSSCLPSNGSKNWAGITGGDAKVADARLRHWLNDHPTDVLARAYLAATYMQTGQNKQAIEQYQVVLQNDPKNILALNNLAALYQQEKDARALATAEQAYLLKADSAYVMDTLGWMLVEQGKTADGLALLQKAVEKAPTSAEIRYHWAAAFVGTAQPVVFGCRCL
jgi:Tfp pilus assembly protein PilF